MFPVAGFHLRERPAGIPQAVVLACAAGLGWVETEGERHAVAPGDVVVLPRDRPHRYGADADDPWTVWWLHAAGTDVDDLVAAGSRGLVRTPGDRFRVQGLIEEVVTALERDTTRESLVGAAGAAWHLFSLLATERPATGSVDRAIEDAGAALRENPAAHVTVDGLATVASLSASYFSSLFRRRFGTSVLRYQTEQRMARARHLLDTTREPVARIASAVGYDDPYYFSRRFRAVHGTTPRAYRAQSKG
ncbi:MULTISPECIES: helix-turn-helix domain-containing protein [unclassified Isoptericola]|uniref:helix-turn-helix domain-containing protein n=1 Tax=unclassified Isoptericola TaxID=2623355 RepID=UPI003667C066